MVKKEKRKFHEKISNYWVIIEVDNTDTKRENHDQRSFEVAAIKVS